MATKKRRAPTTFFRSTIFSGQPPNGNPHGRATVVDFESAQRTPFEQSPFVIVFPAVKHNGGPLVLDLRFLMPLKNVREALRDGHLARLGPKPNANSAISHTKSLRLGIVDFLCQNKFFEVEINAFCTGIPSQFEEWLNQTKNGAARWSETTRACRYLHVKIIFDKLMVNPRWRPLFSHRPRFKVNAWPERTRRARKRPVIDDDLMTRVRLACIKEIVETVRRRSEFERILEEHFAEFNPKKSNNVHAIAPERGYEFAVVYIYKTLIKEPTIGWESLPSSFRYFLSTNHYSLPALRELVFPSPRSLVPFILLLSLAISYNAGTAREIRIGDFSIVREISSYLVYVNNDPASADDETAADVLVNGFKPRSGKRQPVYIPIDDEPDNPHFIFSFILKWTEELRRFSYIGLTDKLFIYCTGKGISTFSGLDGTASTALWNQALAKFREDHSLEHFTLASIRPTSLDAAFEAFDGDIRLTRIQGNHASADTTFNSYLSDAEKQRQYERLGAVHNQRNRWRSTCGTIDPRDHPEGFDLDCATPGWRCADPHDSPFTAKGELCTGYGRCPACPMGKVDLNSPLSYAYTLALLEAIDGAQLSLDANTWLERWGPVKTRLVKTWIPSFSKRAMSGAREIDIPSLPRPE